tara:strand:- start:356 stop:775 length:420 start_codon:yes stop_codon:yes gene_type:complete
MAFKMTGKSPMMKALIGKQGNLPPELKAKIEAAPESATKMKKKSPMEMKKKSPMKLSEEDKKKAMDNAMPDAKVNSRNYDDLKTDKAEMSASKKRLEEAKTAAITGGDDAKQAYDKAKRREAKIQSSLNVAPLNMKKKK